MWRLRQMWRRTNTPREKEKDKVRETAKGNCHEDEYAVEESDCDCDGVCANDCGN